MILKGDKEIQLSELTSDILEHNNIISLCINTMNGNPMDDLAISNILVAVGDTVYCVEGGFNDVKNVIEGATVIMLKSFDELPFLYTIGIIPTNIHDILVCERVMHLGSDIKSFTFDDVAKTYDISLAYDSSQEYKLIMYYQIYEKQLKYAKDNNCITAVTIENMFAPTLAYISWCGFRLDSNVWENIVDINNKASNDSREELNEFVYKNFRTNSKLCKIDMQGDLFEGFKETKKCFINWRNQDKVNSFINDYLIGNNELVNEFNTLYAKFNKAESLCKSFGKNYINSINNISGRIHPIYRQLTDEGRISSPTKVKNKFGGDVFVASAMNLPAEYKKAVIPDDGNCFVIGDWKASEISILAELAGDEKMLQIINSGADIHKYVGDMFGIDRDNGKSVNFIIVYCGSDYTIANKIGVTVERGGEMIKQYAKTFPMIAKYAKRKIDHSLASRYISMFGIGDGYRKEITDYDKLISIKNMFSPKFWKAYQSIKNNPNDVIVKDVKYFMKRKEELNKASISSCVQNTESVMIKLAAKMLFSHIVKNGLFGKVKIILMVHDSIVMECPEDMKQYVREKLNSAMEKANKRICPKVSIGIHERTEKVLC